MHGTTVVHRNDWGEYQVDAKDTHPALATAVGVGIGALLGALAGPAGAAIGAARGAAIGAASGGAVGALTDLDARTLAINRATRRRGFLAPGSRPSSPTSAKTRPCRSTSGCAGSAERCIAAPGALSVTTSGSTIDLSTRTTGISPRTTTISTRTNTSRRIPRGGPDAVLEDVLSGELTWVAWTRRS